MADDLPTVADAASYKALPYGTRYKDPTGNARVKSYRVTDVESYDRVPEGAKFVDPTGTMREKRVSENIPVGAQTLYDMAWDDQTRQNVLAKAYPGGKVAKDAQGYYVEHEGKRYRASAGRSLPAPAPGLASGVAEWAGRKVASVERGAAPAAAGAALGAALGAPFAGVGAIPGAAIGAGAAELTNLSLGAYNIVARQFGLPETITPQTLTDRMLDWAGVPRPESKTDRYLQAAGAGAAGPVALARAAGAVAPQVSGAVKRFAERAATEVPKQVTSGVAGATAAQTAAELGAGPLVQFGAGMFGGGLPVGAPRLARTVTRPRAVKMSPALENSTRAGYVHPPATYQAGGSDIGGGAKVLSAEGGRTKQWQQASQQNMLNTQRSAARTLGLPENTWLNEQAFETARQIPAAVYDEVKLSVPDVTYTKDFKSRVDEIGGPGSLVEKYYPSTATSPAIKALRAELKAHAVAPTEIVMRYMADLRMNAERNFRAPGDAQLHALGLAQRDAARLLEEQLEHSVKDAPGYWQRKLDDATLNVDKWQKIAATSLEPSIGMAKVKEYEEAAHEAQMMLNNAKAKGSTLETLPDRFRAARQMFAKIYDLESVTNPDTGEVSARGLAKMFNKGDVLTGELRSMAESANLDPKSHAIPSQFGYVEDVSQLDFGGFVRALTHGNLLSAAAFAARPMARSRVLAPDYQRALQGVPQMPGAPMTPAAIAGALGAPGRATGE
jgi:hypothetical protein